MADNTSSQLGGVEEGHSDTPAEPSSGASPAPPPSPASPEDDSNIVRRCRARIYLLDESGPECQWDARGTGFLTVEHLDGSVRITVLSEVDGSCLMNISVGPGIQYHLRQDTVITWTDRGVEIGLSFEDSEGCAGVWSEICAAQGRPVVFLPDTEAKGEEPAGVTGGASAGLMSPTASDSSEGSLLSMGKQVLPTPDPNTITAITDAIESGMLAHAHTIAEEVLKNGAEFLSKLFVVFDDLEDLGDVTGLYRMYRLMKNILLLNDYRIFSCLVSDKWWIPFIGIMEYETAHGGPSYSTDTHAHMDTPAFGAGEPSGDGGVVFPSPPAREAGPTTHRKFLKDLARLRLPVPIARPATIANMHETFRFIYLRDVVLARALDDPIVVTLSHLISNNNSDTIGSLVNDPTFLSDLLHTLKCGKREACDYRQGFPAPAEPTGPSEDCSVCSSQSTAVAASQQAPPPTVPSSSDDDDMFIGPRLPPSQPSVSSPLRSPASTDGPLDVTGTLIGPTGLRRDALAMIQDLCNTVKSIQPPRVRIAFFTAVFERGKFLEALESILCDASSTEADVIKAMDVLMVLTQAEPGRIRQHVLGQKKFPATPASIAISRPGNGEKSARYSFPRPPGAVSTAADGAHVGLIAVDDTSPLLQLLIWRLVEDPDTGVQTQAVDLIRALLDFDGAQSSQATSERDKFLEMFYSHYFGWLVQPFVYGRLHLQGPGSVHWQSLPEHDVPAAAKPIIKPIIPDEKEVPIEPPRRQLVFAPASSAGGAVEPGSEPGCDKSSKLAILDLMTLWVSSHSYRFRYVATRNVLCAKILRVLRYRESHLVLAGIRFLKQCIGKDQHYHGGLVSSDVFGPLMAVLTRVQYRDNCINSAIIDLLELIKRENMKPLIAHICDKYADVFRHLRYAPTFLDLIRKHEQQLEYEASQGITHGSGAGTDSPVPQRGIRTVGVVTDIDNYFEVDEDEAMEASSASTTPVKSPLSALLLSPTRVPSPPLGSPRKTSPTPPSPMHRPLPMSPPAILHNSPSNSPRATTLSPEAVRSPPSEVVTANGAGPSTAEATGDTIASAPKPTFVPRAKLLGEKLTSDDSPGFGPFGGPLGRGRGSGRGRGIVFGNRIGGLSSSGPSAPSPSTSLLMAKSGSGGTRTPVLSMLDSIEFVPASPAALAVSDALSKPPTTATGPNPITKVVSSPVVVSPSTSSPSFSLVNYGEVDSDEEEDGGTPGSKRTPALALTPVQSSNGATEVKRRKVEGEQ